MANLATINNNLLADSGIDPVDLIVGTGTVNYIPKFTAEGTIGNSIISQSSTTITIAGNLIANNGASSSLIFLGDVANTTASFFEPQNDGKTSYFGRENSLGNWAFATPVTPYSTVIGAYNSTAPIILGHTNAEVTIANGGATTFISSIATGGDINANTSSAALKANGYQVGKYSYFGYSTGYPGVIIGSSGFQSLFFNVDVSGNPGGSFTGNGSEYIWRNVGSFKTPNAANTEYNTLLSWNSSGQVTIPGATTIGSLTLNGTFYQSTSNTTPVTIYGDSAGINGLFRIEIDEVSDSFGTGARTFLGDGGTDIFIGTANSSYTPSNTYIALNQSGEISMGAGNPATKHLTISTAGLVTIENRLNFIAGSDATNHRNEILVATLPTWGTSGKAFFTDVASYGFDGYGIILQAGYSDGGDVGGMKITDDGIVMWGAGDEDLFRMYNEDTDVLAFRVADNNYAYFISNLYMAGNLVATQSWVNSQGFITGGPYLPLTGGTVTGLVDFSFSSPNITFTPAGYSGSYKTILGTRANAEGVLQLGNNGINYIVAGNTLSGGALQFRVNATGNFLSAITGTTALDIASTGNATFAYNVTLSNSAGNLDVGGVAIIRGNGSAYTTHYLTTGAVNVAAYYQYDAAGNVKNLIHAGAASYITGGNFIVGSSTDSGNPYKIQSQGSILVKGNVNDNYSFYNGVYASSTSTINSQFTANWQSSNNWGIGSKGAADSTVYIGNTSSGVIDPVGTFTLSVLGNTIIRDRLRVNSASSDSDIALHVLGLAGAGKYNFVGRASDGTWSFSVGTDGSTRIGYPQTGAAYRLLTLESSGNSLDTGAVLRIIGNTALDLVDISVADTKTRIYHQENAVDAGNGYGIVQFRTNATPNSSFPTRGGFQFTVSSTDAMFITSMGYVGINNSNPSVRFQVEDSSPTSLNLFYLVNSSTAAVTTKQNNMSFRMTDTVGTRKNAFQLTAYSDSAGGNIENGGLIFSGRKADTDTEWMRIPTTGALWVGTSTRLSTSNSTFKATTASDWGMQIQSPWATAGQNYGLFIEYSAAAPNNTGNNFIQCSDSAAVRFQVSSNGTVYLGSGSVQALAPSGFGYDPNGYKTLILGPTSPTGYKTLCIGVDVSGNASGAFSGAGGEIVWRNTQSWITPNAANNGYNSLLSWNSSAQFTFSQIAYFSGGLTSLSTLTIGDYTQATNTLTFAASANGIAKINFYDSNSTEGLYVRTDGEQYGGTMTFGARWDDDEAKIVFKMYQVSAGATYNARVGIGTGAINPLSMLHVCETDGGNYLGSLRVGGASGFGIVMDYTQSAYTTGTMYVSPGYTSNDTLFKLGAASGNTNQLVLRGNGRVGIGTDAPSSKLQVGLDETAFISIANGGSANVTSGINWLYGSGQINGGGIEMGAPSADNFYMIFKTRNAGSTAERMRLTNDGNLGIGVQSAPGRLTVDYTSYSSAQTPLYVGNTGFTAWNRQSYDTFVLQQDDVTSFRMVEKNGEATTNDQVLSFSIGDGVGRIATSGQPLQFYVNGSPSGLAYQGLSGTQVLAMNTNGNAQFYYALGVTGTVTTTGNYVASNSGIAEIRLQGGGYGGAYNTSLRSIVGAPGVLQMGNNGPNYILAGNTAAGGLLYFRVNCASESTSAGSLALTLNANATATFASSVTATAFFESSDSRIKTLLENTIDYNLIANVEARFYEKNGVKELGYFAQDFEEILSSAVYKDENGLLNLSYTQVHTAKIAALEARVKELENQLKNK
jgi:hypothetical protein